MTLSTASAATNDSPELEALFDSIVSAQQGPSSAPAVESDDSVKDGGELVSRVGHLTRRLYDTLKELGGDDALEQAASAIPDACERLSYIADRTDQAAHRALNAIETARPVQDQVRQGAVDLGARWDQFFQQKLSVDDFRTLVAETRSYLGDVTKHSDIVIAQLNEILMAQDFQDLTGQVIKRVIGTAQDMQTQLLQLLIDFVPEQKRPAMESNSLLNGPVINGQGRSDVVTSQEQVDELLQSLGF
ncbi:MAG: protein phosphatase CheZ [Betaproteobacteria bacterium]|nr:protein phosphatase CheZ [Betaproteobacteria bacterium]